MGAPVLYIYSLPEQNAGQHYCCWMTYLLIICWYGVVHFMLEM